MATSPVITNDDPFGDTPKRGAHEGGKKGATRARGSVSDRREEAYIFSRGSFAREYMYSFYLLVGVKIRRDAMPKYERARKKKR